MVSPASCGQAHATASFSCSISPNWRLKLPIVAKGSVTGLSSENCNRSRCKLNPKATFGLDWEEIALIGALSESLAEEERERERLREEVEEEQEKEDENDAD
jgi:hypothetical protein